MRKLFASIVIMAMAAISLNAIVAPKTPYQYKQPDGTVVTLVNHGDEFHSWTTCGDVVVECGEDGFWRPASDPQAAMQASAASIRRRAEAQQMYLSQKGIGMGNKKFLVILVEFSDLQFTVSNTKQAFSDLLNKEGYSANGATGSAKDYYKSNSTNQFNPSFDVVGPVRVDKSYSYYGKQVGSGSNVTHDEHADEALYDACALIDDQVDFSKYDLDNDGYVDMVFFFYAGHNQAEGAGVNTIWPHAWTLHRHNATHDGVRVYRYACTSEYRGSSGSTMAGIGTFCHEYGHVLGLPDWYDTDYESNGTARDLENLSLMCSGGYNNNGRTPPRLNAMEREILDWMDSPTAITASGNYTINAIQNNEARIIKSTNNGEYFLLEVRDGTSWDSPLYKGLYIYHVDKSNNIVTGSTTAKYLWNNNRQKLNCYANHPCFYVLFSGGSANYGYIPFPGASNVTTYNPVAWGDNAVPYTLQNIAYNTSSGNVTFSIKAGNNKSISGKVTDASGNPIAGASVMMAPKAQSAPGAIHASSVERRDASYSVTTASDGTYQIDLDKNDQGTEFNITASAAGFFNKTVPVEFTSLSLVCDFMLRALDAPSDYNLAKYDPNGNFTSIGFNTTPVSIMAAASFSASEMALYAGMQLKKVTFQIKNTTLTSLHLIVESGNTRLLTKELKGYDLSKSISVDLSSENIIIPASQVFRIGYAIKESTDQHPVIFDNKNPKEGGLLYSSFSLNSPSWNEYSGNLLISAYIVDPNTETGGGDIQLGHLGYNLISDPGNGIYNAGDNFALSIVESVSRKPSGVQWYYDDKSISGSSKKLTAGKHIIKAHLTYADGSTEDLYIAIDVK